MGKAADASPKERQGMNASIFCGPGRTFPIEDQGDVDSAAKLIGKAKNSSAVISCIKGKASAKGYSIPDSWKSANNAVEPVTPSGDNVRVAVFSMGDFAVDMGATTATFADGEPCVVRRGKVFAAGDYPDKDFSALPEHLVVAGFDFEPVPNKVQHIDPRVQPTYFDGFLGTLNTLTLADDGETLIGEVSIPLWFDTFMRTKHPDKPLSVSLEFDRQTKRVVGNTLVPNPRIADSALTEAFAAKPPDTGRGIQAVHDMTVAHGALCTVPQSNMALNHDEFIQKMHDVTKAHGATCMPAKMSKWDAFVGDVKAIIGMEGYAGTSPKAGMRESGGYVPAVAPARAEEQVPMSTTASAEFTAMEQRLKAAEAETERLRKRDEDNARERRAEKAAVFANAAVAAKKIFPAARDALKELYIQAAADDAVGIATFDGTRTGKRTDALQVFLDALPAHKLTEELLKDGEVVQLIDKFTTERSSRDSKPSEEGVNRLLAFTPTGKTILAERAKNGK